MRDRLLSLRSLRKRGNDAAGFVLAGGRSSRMGRDKALLELGSLKLIERACMTLAGAGLEARIAGARNPELAAYGPVVPDDWEDMGPLGGVCSALRQVERNWAVFVTVDQPLMPPALIIALLDRARTSQSSVTVAFVGGAVQTFPAVVRRDALHVLEAELKAGRLGCQAAFRAVGLLAVSAEELARKELRAQQRDLPVERWFWNVNTPEDMEELTRMFPSS